MKYFITGATGFIGGELTRQLVAQGHKVVALVRSPAADLATLGVTLHQGDITDRASLRAGMTGVDGVFHVAAWYKLGSPDRAVAERVNVEGTRNVLEMMRELSIPRGVYTSTLAVFSDTHGRKVDENYRHDGKHLTEYDRTKWLAHYEVALPLARAGLPLVIVQPGVVYGPGDKSLITETFAQVRQGRLWFVPARTAYSWAHVVDVARGHIRAMERGVPGESYILAGDAYSLTDVPELVARLANVAPTTMAGSGLDAARDGATVCIRCRRFAHTFSSETLRASSGVTYLGDDSKARRE